MVLPDNFDRAKTQTICLIVVTVILVTFSIYWLRPVLVPLVVAVFVVSGITPILNALERRLSVNRLVAAGLAFVAGLTVMCIFGLTIWVSMVDLSQNAGSYRKRVQEIVNHLELRAGSVFPSMVASEPDASVKASPSEDASDFVDAFVRDGISMLSQTLLNLVSTSAVVIDLCVLFANRFAFDW